VFKTCLSVQHGKRALVQEYKIHVTAAVSCSSPGLSYDMLGKQGIVLPTGFAIARNVAISHLPCPHWAPLTAQPHAHIYCTLQKFPWRRSPARHKQVMVTFDLMQSCVVRCVAEPFCMHAYAASFCHEEVISCPARQPVQAKVAYRVDTCCILECELGRCG